MNENDLVSILVDNSPLTSEVYSAASNRSPALTGTAMTTLNNAQTGVSARKILEDTLSEATGRYWRSKDKYISALIHSYADSNRLDTLIDVLNDDADTLRQLQLANAMILDGQTSAAGSILSSIATSRNWGDLAKLAQQICLWAVDSVGADTILRDSNLHDLISTWAADTNSGAQTRSRGIMEFLYEMNHDTRQNGDKLISEITVYPEWEQSADKRNLTEKLEDEISEETATAGTLVAYPNPFSSNITFGLPALKGELLLFSMNGILIDRIQVDGMSSAYFEYDHAKLSQGVYLVSFRSIELNKNLHVRIVKL